MLIQEILVLKDGVPLFCYEVSESKLKDPLLSSGFLNAVFQIAKNELKKGISTIKMGSSYIYLKEVSPLLVVVVGDDDREVEAVAERVGTEFLEKYGKNLEDWNGEVSTFKEFREKIARILGRKSTVREDLENTLKRILHGSP
ncbi:MAG: hypothetical protein QXY80_02720 [Candidatus Jordarchaeales archaeon]